MALKGYWVARVDIHDPEQYKKYVAANAEAFGKYHARFLVRAGAFENPEGTSRSRNVVIEFPSYEQALACYRSPEYQRAIALRAGASEADLIIIEGHDDGSGRDSAAGAYWIGRIDVHDPEKYKAYVAADAAPLAEAGGHFIVRGGKFENPEGSARSRNVVIGFDTFEAARACYHSPGYQAAKAHRVDAAESDFIIIEGYRP